MYLILIKYERKGHFSLDYYEEWGIMENEKSLFFRNMRTVKKKLKENGWKVKDPNIKILEIKRRIR